MRNALIANTIYSSSFNFKGGNNFAQMIKEKASKQLGFFIPFCWNVLTPLILIVKIIFTFYFLIKITTQFVFFY